MNGVHIAGAIAIRDGSLLLVASRYPNHPEPLWNLPGGRLEPGELFSDAALRELREETGYDAEITRFGYLNESYDGSTHIVSVVFEVRLGEMHPPDAAGDHVVGVRWEPLETLAERLQIAVVREPLLAYLRGDGRYFARRDAGITIRWDD